LDITLNDHKNSKILLLIIIL